MELSGIAAQGLRAKTAHHRKVVQLGAFGGLDMNRRGILGSEFTLRDNSFKCIRIKMNDGMTECRQPLCYKVCVVLKDTGILRGAL